MGRSIGAVLAGYAVLALLVNLTFFGLRFAVPEVFEPDGPMLGQPWLTTALVAGFLAALAGGWVTALVARRAPFVHALILGALVLGMWFLYAGASPLAVPTWFQIGNLLAGVFGVLLGGALRALTGPGADEAT